MLHLGNDYVRPSLLLQLLFFNLENGYECVYSVNACARVRRFFDDLTS